MSKTTELALVGASLPAHPETTGDDILTSPSAYRHAMELAATLAQSQLLPKSFQGKPADVLMAMILARRMGEDVFTVLQNVHFVGNKPGWSASFLIARANQSGIFSTPLTWETRGTGEDMEVTCSATLAKTGQRVSRAASMRMARTEQWTKNPKYNLQGLAEQMLAYRSATLMLRLYAPQIMYGLHTEDEWQDVSASRGQSVTYEEPDTHASSPPAPRPRPPSAETAPPQTRARAQGERGDPFVALPSGEAGDAHSTTATGSTPEQRPSTSSSSPSAVGDPQSPSGTSSAPTGQDGPGEARKALLSVVEGYNQSHPYLLKEVAKAQGLVSRNKASDTQLQALVSTMEQRIALMVLGDEALRERLRLAEAAALALVGPEDTRALAEAAGLPLEGPNPVLDGAPRPCVERYLYALEQVVQP